MNKEEADSMKLKTMKNKGFFLVLFLGLIFFFGCDKQAEQMVESEKPEQIDEIEISLDDSQLVDEAEVKLPVYPGLKKVASSAGGETVINEVAVTALPSVVGFTEDLWDQVLAFYEEHLADWNRFDFHGTQYFWKGDPAEEFNPANMQRHVTIPSVSIMPPMGEADKTIRVEYIYER